MEWFRILHLMVLFNAWVRDQGDLGQEIKKKGGKRKKKNKCPFFFSYSSLYFFRKLFEEIKNIFLNILLLIFLSV